MLELFAVNYRRMKDILPCHFISKNVLVNILCKDFEFLNLSCNYFFFYGSTPLWNLCQVLFSNIFKWNRKLITCPSQSFKNMSMKFLYSKIHCFIVIYISFFLSLPFHLLHEVSETSCRVFDLKSSALQEIKQEIKAHAIPSQLE